MDMIAATAAATAAIYVTALLRLYTKQRSLIFYNNGDRENGEGFFIASGERRIWLESGDREMDDAPIYFPGNSLSYWISFDELQRCFPAFSVYLLHYSGYGKNSGKPSESSLTEDALNTFDYIKQYHKSVSIVGRSLGSAVGIKAAANREAASLILVTPFSSITDLAKRKYPLFPVSLLIKDPFDCTDPATLVKVPTMVILAENDDTIPAGNSMKLISSFVRTDPVVKILEKTDHADITEHPDYCGTINRFIDSVTRGDKSLSRPCS